MWTFFFAYHNRKVQPIKVIRIANERVDNTQGIALHSNRNRSFRAALQSERNETKRNKKTKRKKDDIVNLSITRMRAPRNSNDNNHYESNQLATNQSVTTDIHNVT